MLADLLDLLDRERLLVDTEPTLTWRPAEGPPQSERLPSIATVGPRLRALTEARPRGVALRGLRTAEGFPNPFWRYTHGQDVLSAWLNIDWIAHPLAERHLTLEFVEPDFLSDVPALAPARLAAKLKTVIGTTLAPRCESLEPAQDAEVTSSEPFLPPSR